MSLTIIKPGLLDTIQDRGRYGWQHLGINPGGAMDAFSMQVANVLAGNMPGEAVIEFHFPAPVFLFHQPALIAVSGAALSAAVNGEAIPCLQPVLVSKNSILQFHAMHSGARGYLSVRGGFELPAWLDSYSTHLKAAAGGYQGRALQKGDELHFREKTDACLPGKKEFLVLPWKANDQWDDDATDTAISILPGKEWAGLTDDSKDRLLSGSFVITSQSDRMGYRLSGEPLLLQTPEELVSSAVCFGTMQLLPDGQLIVLMADHQTTGGYPAIAHVISAQHARLAQRGPGETLHFRMTDQCMAEKLLRKQQQHLQQLQNACTFRLHEFLHK
jgi:antagonist of KipI